MSEAAKIKPVIQKYLKGKIVDVGCGDYKICKEAIGVDFRKTDGVDLVVDNKDVYTLFRFIDNADVVFASHVLEHLEEPTTFIDAMSVVLKHDGILILYLPSARHYDNESNHEHLQSYEYKTFLRWFNKRFSHYFKVIEHGEDIGEDRYSFYLVARVNFK